LRLCEGQYRDIQYEQRATITTDEYLDMVSGKTGALFGASTGIGALVGTEDKTVIGALTDFGERLGIAFQILDDIQGIWGSLEKTGKAQYDDIVDRKKTLPVLYGFQQPVAGEQLARIYRKEAISPEDAEKVAAILRSCGALDYVCDAAERYLAQALETLVAIPGEAGRVELHDIAGSLRDGLTV
ncbi:MAG: polyprenyl synthetase family protein, partial [Chloroflexi bacterium]|nr:polyprenyl synthetase family protein [Chloroflexota bacterium]